MPDLVRPAGTRSADVSATLRELAAPRDLGILTDAELQAHKAKLLRQTEATMQPDWHLARGYRYGGLHCGIRPDRADGLPGLDSAWLLLIRQIAVAAIHGRADRLAADRDADGDGLAEIGDADVLHRSGSRWGSWRRVGGGRGSERVAFGWSGS